MKKYIKKCVSLCLIGTLLLTLPMNAWAAETDEPMDTQDTQSTEDTQDETENEEPKIEENKGDVDGTEEPEESIEESKNKEDGDAVVNPGNPEESDADKKVMEEEGEVTEPITKEDKPYLALGANLTAEQQATVLGLLGINPAELADYDVIYVTNEEEHKYLGEYVASNKIGTKSLSSVLVVKRDKGHGINITTKNISYCTIGMYKNALITAGITDADIIVAGPTPISGTAALVGALKAYSVMTGEEVSEDSIDAALNELVLTGNIAGVVGDSEKAEELLAYLKQQIIENDLDTEEEIQEAVEDACDKFDITLTKEEIGELVSLLMKIKDLDLDLDSIMNQAKSLYDKLSSMGDAQGFFDKVANFFQSIVDFFKDLF